MLVEVLESPSILFARHGRLAPADRRRARRGPRRARRRRSSRRSSARPRRRALRRRPRQRRRALSRRTRTARRGGITGAHDARRPRHDPDAAPRARVPHGAALLAPGRAGARTARGCACSATRAPGCRASSEEPHATDSEALFTRKGAARDLAPRRPLRRASPPSCARIVSEFGLIRLPRRRRGALVRGASPRSPAMRGARRRSRQARAPCSTPRATSFGEADAARIKAIERTHEPRRQGRRVLPQGAHRRRRPSSPRPPSSSTSPAPARTSTTWPTR